MSRQRLASSQSSWISTASARTRRGRLSVSGKTRTMWVRHLVSPFECSMRLAPGIRMSVPMFGRACLNRGAWLDEPGQRRQENEGAGPPMATTSRHRASGRCGLPNTRKRATSASSRHGRRAGQRKAHADAPSRRGMNGATRRRSQPRHRFSPPGHPPEVILATTPKKTLVHYIRMGIGTQARVILETTCRPVLARFSLAGWPQAFIIP